MLKLFASQFFYCRYLNCPRGQNEICKAHEYEGNGCWVERNDFTPPTPQNERPGGQGEFHEVATNKCSVLLSLSIYRTHAF